MLGKRGYKKLIFGENNFATGEKMKNVKQLTSNFTLTWPYEAREQNGPVKTI